MKYIYPPSDCYELFCKFLYKYEQLEKTINSASAKDAELNKIIPNFTLDVEAILPSKSTFSSSEFSQKDTKGRKAWSDAVKDIINNDTLQKDKMVMIKESTVCWSFLTYLRHAIAHAGLTSDDNDEMTLVVITKDSTKSKYKAYGKFTKQKLISVIKLFVDDKASYETA